MSKNVKVLNDERLDDLQCKGYYIIQKKDAFCFGIDAVLLADFVKSKEHDRIVDLGTGTGVIPILMAAKKRFNKITGIEIQEDISFMAQRTVELNDLGHKINIRCENIINAVSVFGKASFDVVVINHQC